MYIFIFTAPTYSSYWCLVGNRWIWMAMGVAGMIITSDYGSFPPCQAPASHWLSASGGLQSQVGAEIGRSSGHAHHHAGLVDLSGTQSFGSKCHGRSVVPGVEGLGDLYSKKKMCIDGDLPHLPHKKVAKIVIYPRKMLIEWWFTVTNKNGDLSGKNECLCNRQLLCKFCCWKGVSPLAN